MDAAIEDMLPSIGDDSFAALVRSASHELDADLDFIHERAADPLDAAIEDAAAQLFPAFRSCPSRQTTLTTIALPKPSCPKPSLRDISSRSIGRLTIPTNSGRSPLSKPGDTPLCTVTVIKRPSTSPMRCGTLAPRPCSSYRSHARLPSTSPMFSQTF